MGTVLNLQQLEVPKNSLPDYFLGLHWSTARCSVVFCEGLQSIRIKQHTVFWNVECPPNSTMQMSAELTVASNVEKMALRGKHHT